MFSIGMSIANPILAFSFGNSYFTKLEKTEYILNTLRISVYLFIAQNFPRISLSFTSN